MYCNAKTFMNRSCPPCSTDISVPLLWKTNSQACDACQNSILPSFRSDQHHQILQVVRCLSKATRFDVHHLIFVVWRSLWTTFKSLMHIASATCAFIYIYGSMGLKMGMFSNYPTSPRVLCTVWTRWLGNKKLELVAIFLIGSRANWNILFGIKVTNLRLLKWTL